MCKITKEVPVCLGGESGQRKRYLRALEKDLDAEFGLQRREKLASTTAVKPLGSPYVRKVTLIRFVIAECRLI